MVYFEEILGIAHVVVVMDYAPMYRGVREFASDLNINFLPPYLPFFIPMENNILVSKNSLKQNMGNEADRYTSERAKRRETTVYALHEAVLTAAVELAVAQITPQLVSQTHSYANIYLSRCLQG